jgi:phage shock protein PspC (stress-responsive transcriptional regulator)
MNEVTKVNLGRQAFTMSVDAYKELQDYLHAIGRHKGGKEVVEEVEVRMAELLAERGITGDRVVLLKDVTYLKEQLGEPGDFGGEDDDHDEPTDDASAPRRLFRDTKHGMVAGVSAGIGNYFSIDPIWVRLAFVFLTLAGASGILLYIVMWLIVPEAKTGSERLQMQGKPVTVDALKDMVDRADVKGAARRASGVAGKVVHRVLKVALGLVGVTMMMGATAALLGLTTASTYWALNRDIIPDHIFPVGGAETLLIVLAFVAAAMVSLFLLFAGLAMVKRKWPLPGWGLGAMIAIFLASVAVGGALAADAVPKVRQRYEASLHTYTRTVPEFNKLHLQGTVYTQITYERSPNYAVLVKHRGDVNFSKLTADVRDQTLTVDLRALSDSTRCEKLCLFDSLFTEVVIRGRKLQAIIADVQGTQFIYPGAQDQTLHVEAKDSSVYLANITADTVKAVRGKDDAWDFTFAGAGHHGAQDLSVFEGSATIAARNIELQFEEICTPQSGGMISIGSNFQKLTLNGRVLTSPIALQHLQESPAVNAVHCLYIDEYSQ